jgi:hypothetical protein
VVIGHRSVILECFGCVELVLTATVHRFVWVAYALLLLQRKQSERNICKSRWRFFWLQASASVQLIGFESKNWNGI